MYTLHIPLGNEHTGYYHGDSCWRKKPNNNKKKDILIISLNWTLLTLYVGTDLIKIMEETLLCFALG